MSKTIKITDESYIKLAKMCANKRMQLLKQNNPTNVGFADIVEELINEYEENRK